MAESSVLDIQNPAREEPFGPLLTNHLVFWVFNKQAQKFNVRAPERKTRIEPAISKEDIYAMDVNCAWFYLSSFCSLSASTSSFSPHRI